MTRRHQLTQDQINEMLRAYSADFKSKAEEVAEQFGVSVVTLRKYAHEAGIHRKPATEKAHLLPVVGLIRPVSRLGLSREPAPPR